MSLAAPESLLVKRSKQHTVNLQPLLEGANIEVRPLRQDDQESLYSVASDPLIWEQHPVSNRHTREEFNKYFSESLASGGALLVIDTHTRAVIGSSRYHGYDEERSEVEIGWTFLARSHWGGKYNGELKQLMLNHASKFVDTVIFYIGPENKRSQRAVEKIGGVQDPELDNQGRAVFRIPTSARRNQA